MTPQRRTGAGSAIQEAAWEYGAGSPLIRKLQGLANLEPADIAVLEQISANARVLGPNVELFREDAAPDHALIVLDGFACRYKQRQAGARQILAYLLPGDLWDGDAPYHGRMGHAVGTLSTCVVARVSHQALAELLTRHPNLAQALHLAKLAEAATAWEWIVNLGCRSATERMSHLFCELMARMEAVGLVQDGSCPLPLTQGHLADTLGLSNVHVNRTLQDLRRQGLIEWKGRSLTVLKPQRVRDLAEFNPAYLRPGTRA
jgi:CRP-like cAMP-binding protein